MNLDNIQPLLNKINGATFAGLDAVTKPKPMLIKETTGCVVLIHDGKHDSGYASVVRGRLDKLGLDSSAFHVDDLPWGKRVPETPLIEYLGSYYLQTIVLNPGTVKWFLEGLNNKPPMEIDPNMAKAFGAEITRRRTFKQGLPVDKQVTVAAWALQNIKRITILGETLDVRGVSGDGAHELDST